MRKLTALLMLCLPVVMTAQIKTSVAGFYQLENSGRQIYNFNPGWRFYKGDVSGAEKKEFDDSGWEVISTPHKQQKMQLL